MRDRMVELTRFTRVSEAEILANLLQSEGIGCYVRDGYMNQIYDGLDLGGVKVELLEKDLERALEIMKDYGYSSPNDNPDRKPGYETEGADNPEMVAESDELDNLALSEVSEDDIAGYEQNRAKLSRNMTIITALIILLAVIIILLNKYYSGL